MIEIKTAALLPPSAVAKRLKVTRGCVVLWANSGRLNPILDSEGDRLFPLEQIEQFERDRERTRTRKAAVK